MVMNNAGLGAPPSGASRAEAVAVADAPDGAAGAGTVPVKPGKKYGKLAKQGVVWSFFREGVSELITTPTAMIMARLLTPFDFGVAASAAFFMTLAMRLTNFGFNQALVRIKVLKPEHGAAVFVVSLLLGVSAYTALYATSGMIAAFFREPEIARMLPVAALTFLIVPFGTVPAALMSRDMQFKRNAIVDWTNGLVEAGTAVVFAWAGYGYWSIVYGRLGGAIVGTAMKLILGSWRPSVRFSRADLGDLMSFGAGLFAKRFLDYTAKNLDNLVVGRMLGVVSLGFYDKAFITMNKALIRINTGGPMVSFRVFALIQEEPERFRKAYGKVVLGASLLTYPVLLGLAALGPDLIPVMYGPRWELAIVPFQILCVAGTLKVMNEYAGSAVQAFGRIWSQVSRQVIYVALVVLCVAVLSRWGLPGAAAGVFIATCVMYVLMQALLVGMTSLSARDTSGPQLPGVLCGILVAAVVVLARWGLIEYTPWLPQWLRLLAQAAAGAAAFLAFVKFNRFRDVRRLVRDVAGDLSPALGRVVGWLA